MRTLFSLFVYLIIILPIHAEESLTYSKENKSEKIVRGLNATITNVKLSPDHSLRAVLYESQNTLEEGNLPEQVLKIALPDGHLWLRPGDWVNYSKLKFLDNRRLILSRCTLFVCDSIIVDTLDRKIVWLGKGEYETINNSLIKLTGQKYYFPAPKWGAFWVDMIVDAQGSIIKILAPNSKYLGECVPISLILDQDKEYPKLEQSMKECVYVER
jgi:hypothetical protein